MARTPTRVDRYISDVAHQFYSIKEVDGVEHYWQDLPNYDASFHWIVKVKRGTDIADLVARHEIFRQIDPKVVYS